MSKEVITRPYQIGDEEEIVSLLQRVFNGWPKFDLQCSSLDHWKWKYLDNPLKLNAIALAESDGKIVGSNHGSYSKLKMGDQTLLAQQGGDLAIEKEFRGMKLFPKMQEVKDKIASERNANITYSLSTNQVVLRGELKSRLQFPSPLLSMIKVQDIDLHLKMSKETALIKKYGYITLKTVNQIKNLFTFNYNKVVENIEINTINEFEDNIDVFWDKIKNGYNFIFFKNKLFLNWRYSDKRSGNFIIRQASEKGIVLGYIVIRINRYRKEYPIGYIADLITLPNRLDIANVLLRDAEEYFWKQGVNITHSIAITDNPKEKLYSKNDYIKNIEKYYLLYTPVKLGKEHEVFRNSPPDKLYFDYGDLDWV